MLLAKDLLLASGSGDFPTDPVRFDYTGAVQTYTVPQGCKKIHVDAVGAAGGSFGSIAGGKGGRVECDLIVASRQILYIYVGGVGTTVPFASSGGGMSPGDYAGGWNGGGNSRIAPADTPLGNPGGGGATDIRTIQATAGSWYITNHSSWNTDSSLLSRLVVAGAGGGASDRSIAAGGGLVGQSAAVDGYIATGGTQTEPGYYCQASSPNNRGNYGHFGAGSYFEISEITVSMDGGGGGAGSGWYGGGSLAEACIAGGGSSYAHPSMCSNVIHTQGFSSATGNGWLIITPLK